MTLGLQSGGEVKTFGHNVDGNIVHMTVPTGELSLHEFLEAAWYVLTNTDLGLCDPRLDFMVKLASLSPAAGHNPGGVRLAPGGPSSSVRLNVLP